MRLTRRLFICVLVVSAANLGCSDSDGPAAEVTPELEAGQKQAEQQAADEEMQMQREQRR